VWNAIEQAGSEKKAPFLIYQESDIVVRALRDHYRSDIGEILIDSEKHFRQAQDFMTMVMPGSLNKLKLFEDKLPLFNRFQIENQIESAFNREVSLPSGGAIVIDHTEALTSIDVNSARATRGSDIEETAKNTNLEAADEIARQLRIRDLGGLIVIDFIDMMQNKNQRDVESRLRNAVYDDRARVQIGRISRFGLLEMSRQRLRPSLEEASQIVCPRCSGQGTIRDVESLALAVLRLLEDEALKDNTGKILAKIPVDCATYLLNEKRAKIDDIERRREVNIVVIPDPKLETPHYVLERVKDNDTHRHESNYKKSYELTTEEEPVDYLDLASSSAPEVEKAAVQRIAPTALQRAAPVVDAPPAVKKSGFFAWLAALLGGTGEDAKQQTADKETASASAEEQQSRGGNRNRRGNRRSSQGRPRDGSQSKATETAGKDAKDSSAGNSEGRDSKRSGSARGGRSRGGRSNRGSRQRQGEERSAQSNQPAAESAAAGESGAETKSKPRRERSPRKRTNPNVDNGSSQDSKPTQDSRSTPPAPSQAGEAPPAPAASGNGAGIHSDASTQAHPDSQHSTAGTPDNKTSDFKPAGNERRESSAETGSGTTAGGKPATVKPAPAAVADNSAIKPEI
jgi:ribonuclease E